MFIDNIRLKFAQFRPQKVKTFVVRTGARAGNQFYVRVFLLDSLGKPFVALQVLRSPLLVATPAFSC